MGSEDFDVVIVGAGPAGSTAAFFLGQAGLRVAVLEKERLPRYKVCGGGVPERILRIFPFSFEPVIQSRVKTVTYTLGDRAVTHPLPERPIRMVMRSDFDQHILSHSHAEVFQEAAVRDIMENDRGVTLATRDGRQFSAHYLVGADGANSIVARKIGLRSGRVLAAAIEVEAPVPTEVFARFRDQPVFIFGEIPMGYLWIFPKAEHLSVGIAAYRPKPGELQSVLRRVMARHGISIEGLPVHGHPIPIYVRRERLATRRSLLVGDAAGLVDPMNGEGIRFAIKSGQLAAEAILAGQLDRYAHQVHRRIGFNHQLALGLGLLFYKFPRACYHLGVRNPFTCQAFADLLSDQADYPEVLVRMFATLPLYLATEGFARLAGRLAGPDWTDRVRAVVYSS
jgi:geranylgeranyl reductase family protein